jgi:hypothetical protein
MNLIQCLLKLCVQSTGQTSKKEKGNLETTLHEFLQCQIDLERARGTHQALPFCSSVKSGAERFPGPAMDHARAFFWSLIPKVPFVYLALGLGSKSE